MAIFNLYSNGCCTSQSRTYPTCSNPFSQDGRVSRLSFCPEPPYVSINDFIDEANVGPVDGDNIFVAEKLLNVGEEMGISGFHRDFMVSIFR